MITILIPAYNNLLTLERAIISLSAQSIASTLNIIVSDDCSPNISTTLLEKLVIRYFRCFRELVAFKQPQNLGVMSNKEWLVRKVRTELFAFHEHDDWIINEYFYENAIKKLIQNQNTCCFFGNAIIQQPNQEIKDPNLLRSQWMYDISRWNSCFKSKYSICSGLSLVKLLINSSMETPFNTSWSSIVIRKHHLDSIGGFGSNYTLTAFESNLLKVYREEEHYAFIYFLATQYDFALEEVPSVVRGFDINAYSRSPYNPARKLKQDSSYYAFYKLSYFIDRSGFDDNKKQRMILELFRHCIKLGIVEQNEYTDKFLQIYSPQLESIKQLLPQFFLKSLKY